MSRAKNLRTSPNTSLWGVGSVQKQAKLAETHHIRLLPACMTLQKIQQRLKSQEIKSNASSRHRASVSGSSVGQKAI